MAASGEVHDTVRSSYDAVAADYAERFDDELDRKPFDRAMLGALAEQTGAGMPIADIGCGPGHVAAFLAAHGTPAVGIDLSPAMVAEARRRHAGATYREGDLLRLPAADGEFGSAVAFYSVIHLGAGELPSALAEVRRVLCPGGRLLLAFHAGDEVRHRDEWLGHDVDLDFHFFARADVEAALERAAFSIEVAAERVAYAHEVETTRCYLLARRR